MRDSIRNVFLDKACTQLKALRPLVADTLNFSFRVECIAGASFVPFWFRSRGCRHDHHGGCTMCNYLKSVPVPVEEMIRYVGAGLSLIPADENMVLLVSPSGSMLDEWEVPAQAREGILQLVRNTSCKRFLCETRPETVTDAKIKQYADILSNKALCVELGLESANPWIMRYSINKALSLMHYLDSISILRKYEVASIANIIVGSPFLTVREVVEDAVETVRWAVANGTDSCVVFPVHVKQWTLVEWLWKHGLYSPVSLWSLVEVLARLGPELAPKVTISWYKTYSEQTAWGILDPKDDLGYLASPVTCRLCQPTVMSLLDAYRDTNDYAVVQELASMKCGCKDAWRAELEAAEQKPLIERVSHAYEAIGLGVLGTSWWSENGAKILRDVQLS